LPAKPAGWGEESISARRPAQRCIFYTQVSVFPFAGNNLDCLELLRPLTFAMLPVVIVLLLLTALVATDPSSSGGNGDH